jgi:hypothetical protein
LRRSARFPGPARRERTAARTASRAPSLVGCQSQRQRWNCAVPTSPQSNAHCRKRCRTPTPSRFGGRDAPPSRPRRYEPSTRCHPSADHCHPRKAPP